MFGQEAEGVVGHKPGWDEAWGEGRAGAERESMCLDICVGWCTSPSIFTCKFTAYVWTVDKTASSPWGVQEGGSGSQC